jgi:membrane protein DedA with SNARE-associated domain
MLSLSALVTSSFSLPLLFALTIAASYVIIPIMGWIIVSFGANTSNLSDLIILILVVYSATLIGDISIYFIAKYFSKRVLKFVRRFKWYKKHEKRYKKLLNKYGFWIVFVSRFLVSEVCLVVNYISGFERFNSKKFISAVILGELVFSVLYVLFGYLFKDTWTYLLGLVQNSIRIILLILIALYILYRIIKLIKNVLKSEKEKIITSSQT